MRAAIAGVWLLLCLAAPAAPPAFAQEPPKITSPEVRADLAVAFRLWAPRATEVRLSGNEFPGPHSLPVARTQLAELLPVLFRESR